MSAGKHSRQIPMTKFLTKEVFYKDSVIKKQKSMKAITILFHTNFLSYLIISGFGYAPC